MDVGKERASRGANALGAPDPSEESALIAAAGRGDAAAFCSLVQAHQGRVRAFLGASIRRADVVDDLAQEVFLNAYRSLDAFRGESSFGVWLLGIARNKLRMFLRDEVRRGSRDRSAVDQVLAAFRLAELDGVPGSVSDLDRERELLALQKCLEGLSPTSGAMISQRYFKAQSVAEIAQGTGQREGSVRMTLLRLRQALRACVQQRLGEGKA